MGLTIVARPPRRACAAITAKRCRSTLLLGYRTCANGMVKTPKHHRDLRRRRDRLARRPDHGSNGSGKSSVFDAFLQWDRHQGRPTRRGVPATYFDSATGAFTEPAITPHPATNETPSGGRGSRLHVRTAHRNTPDVVANSVEKQPDFRQRTTFERMIDTDATLREHYQRLVTRFLPLLSRLDSPDIEADLKEIREQLSPVQDSLTRVLPHLRFTNLGDSSNEGSFHFVRDGERNFRYENLSGGEKAVFDLLLDVHIASIELGTPLVCLDEPELHLNPAVQAAVLTELMGLLPAGSQLWIATHSVGMIRRAFEISAEEPNRVAFLDFGQVEGPLPDVRLEPKRPSRQLLRDAMTVALDDIVGLLAPEVLIICEGAQDSDRVHVWDERVYRQIFRDLYQRVEFKSSGGKTELDQAAAIAAVLAPGTRVLKLRDRDGLTSEHRERKLAEDPNLRVLQRRSLESYLLDDEVLEALVRDRGSRHQAALDQLRAARDEALRPNGSAKGSLGKVFEAAKRVLSNAEELGENASEFSAEVLAALITPEMAVREELKSVLDLDL